MPKLLTVAAVERLKPGSGRREVRDGGAMGLYLVVQTSGAKAWALRFRRPDGRPAKMTLGPLDISGREPVGDPVVGAPLTLAAARALAAEVHRQRATGVDVAAQSVAGKRRRADAGADTFGALARRFIDEYARPRIRRWRETARTLGLDYPGDGEPSLVRGGLTERWHDKPVTEIGPADIYDLVDGCRRHGIPGLARPKGRPVGSTRGLAMARVISKLFSWLMEHRRITTNPCLGMHRPPAPPARERALSGDEIRWFWQACDQLGELFGPLHKLLLLTGARRQEVGAMTRDELSDDLTTWSLSGARTKNHKPHVVLLPPLARDLIASMPGIEGGSGFIFTTTGMTPTSGWSKAKVRLDRLMLDIARQEAGRDVSIPAWRIHDLRRTSATGMAELGIAPHVIELLLNHISGHRAGVAGIYNRSLLLPERKTALERWAVHIEGLVSGRPANVVAMRR